MSSGEAMRVIDQSFRFEDRPSVEFSEEDFTAKANELMAAVTKFCDDTGIDAVVGLGGFSTTKDNFYGLAIIRARPVLMVPIVNRIVSAAQKMQALSEIDKNTSN